MAPRAGAFQLDTLSTTIPSAFDQAQSSAATHKKNCVALFKLHHASAAVTDSTSKGVVLTGEKTFSAIFLDMLNRALVVKKGNQSADRIIRFVASYTRFLNEKTGEDSEDDTYAARFVSHLLKHLLKGFLAKNKDVRFRCVSAVSEVVTGLGEIDQDLYKELRESLVERLADKEPLVRAHSVAALSKLAASEDPDDIDGDERSILSHLLINLTSDPAAEVRRAALVHIPFTPETLPALLTRARDVDAVARKLVYATILPRLEHPKQLTISQRELVVVQGLGDREDAVRVAAAKLLGSWLDSCDGDLVVFSQLFDIRTTGVTLDALKSLFVTRTEMIREFEFDDSFWSHLQPEAALLARAFVEHCIDQGDQAQLELTLPVVTALAFHLQTQYNIFLEKVQQVEEFEQQKGRTGDIEEMEVHEEESANAEFVMAELLSLATHLDYSDEIGRRKMFGVIRNMLAHPELPEALIKPAMAVLSVMSPNERDLIRIVVEVVNELKDAGSESADELNCNDGETATDDESIVTARPSAMRRNRTQRQVQELSPEEKAQADITDLRCLYLCIAVLERISVSFEENSTLEGILADLIIPCVKRKELILRENGLVALGLCCLIAKSMALSSFQLFLSQVKSAPESLRLKVLQVIFDILMTYEHDIMGGADSIGERVITFIMQVLEAEESKSVQALICLGLSKLMLLGLVTDARVLTSLVLAYVSPASADNQELRQCLAYFLPVYCYTSPANQRRMQSTFVTTYDLVCRVYEDMEDDQDMITPLQFGQLFIDWTDSSKVVAIPDAPDEPVDGHASLAIDIVRALYEDERTAHDKKILCQLLSKLVFPPAATQHTLYMAYLLASYLPEICPLPDVATARAFTRFHARFTKRYADSLSEYSEEALFGDEDGAYAEVFEFIGVSKPRRRVFEIPAAEPTSRRAAKQRETSMATETASDSEVSAKEQRNGRSARVGNAKQEDSAVEHDSSASSSSSDSEPSPVKKPANGGKVTGRSRKKAGPPKSPTPSVSSTSDVESVIRISTASPTPTPTPPPSTPPRKSAAKRLHTPTKTPSMPSPEHKRPNRATRTATVKAKSVDAQPAKSTVASRRSTRAAAAVKPPPKLRASAPRGKRRNTKAVSPPASERDEDAEQHGDEIVSDASIPARMARPRAARVPPPMLEEKIGWDSSSEP